MLLFQITLFPCEYLESLATGKHTVAIVSSISGEEKKATAEFTVAKKAADTGVTAETKRCTTFLCPFSTSAFNNDRCCRFIIRVLLITAFPSADFCIVAKVMS